MSLHQNVRYRDRLKHVGHDLIDDLVRHRIPRYRVYKRLARTLGVPEREAHFANVHDGKQLERMVAVLRGWLDDIERRRPKLVSYTEQVMRHKRNRPDKRTIIPTPPPPPPKITKKKKVMKKVQRAFKNEVLPYHEMKKALADLKKPNTPLPPPPPPPKPESPLLRILKLIGVV